MGQKDYELALGRAVQDILVIAARYGINTRHIVIAFDVGRDPARYNEHTITIAIRDSDIAVAVEGVPHDWLDIGTGFIDTRLYRRISPLIFELEHKAQEAGRLLD